MKKWTKSEETLLLELLNNKINQNEISKILNKSKYSINQYIKHLNKNRQLNKWTNEEIELLKKLIISGCSFKEICLKLNRSYKSVEHQKAKLGLKLSDYRNIVSKKDIIIPKEIINNNKNNETNKWSVKETNLLKSLIKAGFTIKEIGEKLNRTYKSVERKKSKLGLKTTNYRNLISKEDIVIPDSIINKNKHIKFDSEINKIDTQNLSIPEISKKLNIHESTVRRHLCSANALNEEVEDIYKKYSKKDTTWFKEDNELLIELINNDKSFEYIFNELNKNWTVLIDNIIRIRYNCININIENIKNVIKESKSILNEIIKYFVDKDYSDNKIVNIITKEFNYKKLTDFYIRKTIKHYNMIKLAESNVNFIEIAKKYNYHKSTVTQIFNKYNVSKKYKTPTEKAETVIYNKRFKEKYNNEINIICQIFDIDLTIKLKKAFEKNNYKVTFDFLYKLLLSKRYSNLKNFYIYRYHGILNLDFSFLYKLHKEDILNGKRHKIQKKYMYIELINQLNKDISEVLNKITDKKLISTIKKVNKELYNKRKLNLIYKILSSDKKFKWTGDDIKKLKIYYFKTGLTISNISKKLNKDISDVKYMVNQLKIHTNYTWTGKKIKALKDMYKQGCSTTKISKKLDINRKSISAKIYNMGLNKNNEIIIKNNEINKWTDEETNLLKTMIDNGFTLKDIGEKLNRTYKSVERKKSRLNL